MSLRKETGRRKRGKEKNNSRWQPLWFIEPGKHYHCSTSSKYSCDSIILNDPIKSSKSLGMNLVCFFASPDFTNHNVQGSHDSKEG